MTDDRIVKDTARDPEREALGPMRGGIRAAAGRAARKVAKKVAKKAGQKKTAKKTAATAGRTAKKTAKAATKRDKPAAASASRATRASADRPKAASASAAAPDAAAAKAAAAASRVAVASEAAASGTTAASEGVASTSAAPTHEAGSSIEAPRPPGPMHPGAYTDPTQEQSSGLGGVLALWGPLIIVGFLVLIFRGGEERGSTVAAGSDAPTRPAAAAGAPEQIAGEPQAGSAAPIGARPPERASGPPGAGRGVAEAFDRGFAMRTSMAGSPVFAGREPGAPMPAGSPGRLYPSPPGPYRDPTYRGMPADERWPAAGANDWVDWSAGGREDLGHEAGGDAPAHWVRCAPPYYWCPAPGSPAW